jgi:Zn-finger nucleic acid-binding protein
MSQCPVCEGVLLTSVLLEDDLPACRCEQCQGILISSEPYRAWLEARSAELRPLPSGTANLPVWDSEKLKFCPDCGWLMRRYNVLPGSALHLDHCANCNAAWCDRGEWDTVIANDLSCRINQLFTEPWQHRVREEEQKAALDFLYLKRFGECDYARVKEVHAWLDGHPRRSELLAFLQAITPYRP